MAFNYILAQTAYHPYPNNYCGGFALDAILYDLNGHNPQPIETYNGIQASQNGLAANSQALINKPELIAGDTYISLPSSIAIYASQSNMHVNVCVFVNNVLVNAIPDFGDVLPEEKIRIQNNNILYTEFNGSHTLQDVLDQNELYSYYIVLVNEGGHWVAVKKENGRYCMYDPADGSETSFDANGNILQCYNWNGVAIGIGL